MSVANPPRRPFKSRLRKTISISQISSPIPQSPIQSPVSPTESIQGAFSTEDLYSKLRVTPGIPPLNAFKSTEQGRFSDQYLSSTSLRTSEDTASIDIKKYNTSNMKGSQSLTTSLRDSLTPPASVQDTEDYKVIEKPTTGIKIKSSISTPLQLPKGVPRLVPRKFGSNGSLITPKTVPTPSYIKNNSSTSVNRAQAIIQRLENWNSLLKGLTAWLEEASKITMSSSRAFAVRAYSVLNGDDNEHDVNHNFYSTLQELTMQLAAEQQEVSNSLEHEHLPDLQKLRKECRDKIQKLKADQSLSADELLRRAELTRAKMTHLDRCCKQADKATGQVEMDPWVANLLVLQHLKKETEEENRLRSLMVPIQKDTKAFEKRIIGAIKPVIDYCYKAMLPQWEDVSYKKVLDKIMPDHEWIKFCEEQKAELVDEQNLKKDYLKFNYPNKFHPLVMTLLKGTMEKKTSVRRQYLERYYVLSQGGYLHEFDMDDKVNPERSFYIPATTIVPCIEIIKKRSTSDHHPPPPPGDGYTFEICKPSTAVLQRDKISVFRTKTREDLIKWCGLLVHLASGISLSTFGLTERDVSPHNPTLPQEEVKPEQPNLTDILEVELDGKVELSDDIAYLLDEIPIKDTLHNKRSMESIKSFLSEESFNEPAVMNKDKKQEEPKRNLDYRKKSADEKDLDTPPFDDEINVTDIYNAMDTLSDDSATTIKAASGTSNNTSNN